MGHGDLAGFGQVLELLVTTFDVVDSPTISLKMPDYLSAFHCVYSTHYYIAMQPPDCYLDISGIYQLSYQFFLL